MEMKTYTYIDPTGGGEDAEVTLPIWAIPPVSLKVRDVMGDPIYFELEEDEE